MWEDVQNKSGGRWLVNLNKNQRQTELDNFWLETVSIDNLLLYKQPNADRFFKTFTGFCPGRAFAPFVLKNSRGHKNPNRWP